MSKNEVLEQVYPDEVSGILKKANIERARQRERELTGYFYTLMAPALPWMKGEDGLQKDLIESITGELSRIHKYLDSRGSGIQGNRGSGAGEQNNFQPNQPDQRGQQEDPFEQLKKLQGIIAQTWTKKAR